MLFRCWNAFFDNRKFLKFPTSKNLIGMISKLAETKKYHVSTDEKNLKRLDSKEHFNFLKIFIFRLIMDFYKVKHIVWRWKCWKLKFLKRISMVLKVTEEYNHHLSMENKFRFKNKFHLLKILILNKILNKRRFVIQNILNIFYLSDLNKFHIEMIAWILRI